MTRFIIRRILWLIPVLFAVTVITFVLMHSVPGGPWSGERNLAPGVDRVIGAKYHLNEPIWQQYGRWVYDFVRGDFGPSFKYADRSVSKIIAEGLPATLLLGVMSFVVSVAVGIPLGIIAALGHNRWPDYAATGISLIGICTPTFVLAILLIVVFSVWLKVLPPLGWKGPDTWVMPVLALAGYQIAQIARYTRASMLEVTRKDYIRTAHSKGLRERAVVVRHAFRNALIPVVTVVGLSLPGLVGGAVLTETVFAWPGIGRLAVGAVFERDYPVIMGVNLLVATVVIAANLLTDLAYCIIDPRISYS